MRSVVRKLRNLLSSRDRFRFLGLLMLLVALALLEMAGIASIMPFMAVVMNPEAIHSNSLLRALYERFGFQSDGAFLVFAGYCVLGLLVLTNSGKALSIWLSLRFQNRLVYTMSRRLLASYMARPYQFFLGRNTADLGSTLLVEATRVITGVLAPAMDFVSSALVSGAILALLIVVNPVIAALIIAILGGAYVTVYLLVHWKLSVIGNQQVEANKKKYICASEALSGIKDLKVLGREAAFLGRFSYFAERHSRNAVIAGVIAQLPRYALEIIAFGGILSVVLYLISQGRQSEQILPLLALYAFAGYRLLPALQTLFAAITSLKYNKAALDLVHKELTGSATPPNPEQAWVASVAAQPLKFEREIELRNVSFRYDGAEDMSLKGLSLTIRHHTSIGLVGPTGCGKTTTADVILGLLVPQSGSILVDGVEIGESNRAGWQKLLGYVPQQIYISDDTLARNIAFGVPYEQIDMGAVKKAAAIANLDHFIENELPAGYDTNVGERGVRLSGGQRQRIGIARAMYHDPSILVMDEATSALDGVTEDIVMGALRNLSGRKTVILIAHRLTTVEECDLIYQLDRGTVAASGSYADLMRDSAWFRAAAKEPA